MRFKQRNHLYNQKEKGEAASPDVDAEASYPEYLSMINDDGGYVKQQIFVAEETAFYWNKIGLS